MECAFTKCKDFFDKTKSLTTGALISLMVSGCTDDAPKIEFQDLYKRSYATVKQNSDTMLNYWLAVDASCAQLKFQTIELKKPAKNGSVYFSDYITNPSYSSINARFKCNSQKYTAISLHYKPTLGFTGDDFIPVNVSGPMGETQNVAFKIRVIP